MKMNEWSESYLRKINRNKIHFYVSRSLVSKRSDQYQKSSDTVTLYIQTRNCDKGPHVEDFGNPRGFPTEKRPIPN